MDVAREHFGCSSLSGVELDNDHDSCAFVMCGSCSESSAAGLLISSMYSRAGLLGLIGKKGCYVTK